MSLKVICNHINSFFFFKKESREYHSKIFSLKLNNGKKKEILGAFQKTPSIASGFFCLFLFV